MRRCLMHAAAALFALTLGLSAAGAEGRAAKRRPAGEVLAEALVARLPQDKLYEAAGFFGPVVRKYRPVIDAFQREYAASDDRMAVVAKYAPMVDAALAEAKAMKVPPRFEKQKAEYIRLAEVFAASLRAIVRMRR